VNVTAPEKPAAGTKSNEPFGCSVSVPLDTPVTRTAVKVSLFASVSLANTPLLALTLRVWCSLVV
jgi:hypothetical protein